MIYHPGMPPIAPVRARSSFTFGQGASHVEQLVERARSLGYDRLGLADRHSAAGFVRFATACQKHGVVPLFGAELCIAPKPGTMESTTGGWVTALVQDGTGFRNLSSLLGLAPLGSRRPIPLNALLDARDGLLLLSGNAEDGLLPKTLARHPNEAKGLVRTLSEAFPERLFLEVERLDHEDRGNPIERGLLALALDAARPIPLIATTPIWFATEERRDAWRLLRAISANQPVTLSAEGRIQSQDHRERASPIMPPEWLRELFADLPEAARNARDVFERCAWSPAFRAPQLPRLDLRGADPNDRLADMAASGLAERLRSVVPHDATDVYDRRLKEELAIISATGFASYFLIVAEFVTWARSQGIPVGPGRGSGVGSVVAWALGITEIDPIRHGLLFERFLNPERVSMPDFDIDFCERRRYEVIRHVIETHGEANVAAISTFSEIRLKTAIKDVSRILLHADGSMVSFADANSLTKLLPSGADEPGTVAEAMETLPLLREKVEADPRFGDLLRLAEHVKGLYRQAGTHAAGIVIADRPLIDVAPVHPSSDAENAIGRQIGLDMGDCERLGLVKFDFLGLSTTTLLDEAERTLAHQTGERPDWSRLDRDDPDVLEAFRRGDTLGIFQFESAGMRSALSEVQPERFSDLVAINALFRPGPIKYIQEFARRKSGKAEWSPPPPIDRTGPILRETHGIMIYQEQVMEIARACAGYSLGAADVLRRAMGKKKPEEMAKQKAIFLDGDGKAIPGAIALGMRREEAERLFEDMASFAGYGFNKSHAVAYSDLAWRTMWFKVYHPELFTCALLNAHISEQDKLAEFHQEMTARGLRLLQPDALLSRDVFSVCHDEGAPEHVGIRMGLNAVRGIGDSQGFIQARDRIVSSGTNVMDALLDLAAHHFNARQLDALAAAGAFDRWSNNRRMMLECLLARRDTSGAATQSGLLDEPEGSWLDRLPPRLKALPDWENRVERQIHATGIDFQPHPIQLHKELLFSHGVRRLSSFLAYMERNRMPVLLGAKLAFLPTLKPTRLVGRNRTPMLSISAAEMTDRYDVLFFEGGCRQDLGTVRHIAEAASRGREPVIATVDISMDAKTGQPLLRGKSLASLTSLLVETPARHVAHVARDADLAAVRTLLEADRTDAPHDLEIRADDEPRTPLWSGKVDVSALAILSSTKGVRLERLS